MSTDASVAQAYAHCESVTRTQAANFYWGIRLLSGERRLAMCAVYAFARRVDDIGDGALGRQEKLDRLDGQARALADLQPADERGLAGSDPVMVALADVHARFALPPGALGELIEGVRMDVNDVRYETFDELVVYCRRVAGAIGRVSLAIFGSRRGRSERPDAERLADNLGVAMQLTNILRDLREDAENGRVYVPAEDLVHFGLIAPGHQAGAAAVIARLARGAGGQRAPGGEGAPGGQRAPGGEGESDGQAQGRLEALVRFQADRAETWFESGRMLAPLLDRRSAACVRAMAGIYRRLLARIKAQPERALRQRTSLPAREKAWVAAGSLLGGRT